MFYDTPRLENSFRGGSDRIKPKRREKNSTHKSRTDNEKIQIKTKRKGEATTDHHADSSDERPTASFSRGVSKRSRDNDRDTIIKIRGQTYDKSGHGVDIRKTGAFSSLSTEECESDTLRFHFFYKTFNFLKQTIIVSTKYNCDKKCKISKKFFIVSSFLCLIYIVICYFGSSVEIVSEILKTSSTYMVDMTTMFQWSRDDSSVKHGVDFKRNSEENRTYDTGKRKTERIRTSEESRKNDPPKDNDDMLTALSIVVDKKLKKYERMMVDILKFINKHIYNEVLEYIKSCEFEINIDNDMFKQTKNDNIKISVADVHRLINDKIVSTLKSMRKYAKYELFEESGEINKEEDDDEEEYLMFEFLSDVFLLSEQKRDKNDDQMRHRQHDLHSVMYDILNKETTRHVFDYLISNSKEYRCCCKRASNEKQLQTAYACGTELPSKYKRQPEGGVNIDYDNFPICFLENNRYIYDNIVKPNQSDSKSTTRNNDGTFLFCLCVVRLYLLIFTQNTK